MSKTFTFNETELAAAISSAIAPHMEAITGHGKQLDDLNKAMCNYSQKFSDHCDAVNKKFGEIDDALTKVSSTPQQENKPPDGSDEGNKDGMSASITKKDLETMRTEMEANLLKAFAAAGNKGTIVPNSVPLDDPTKKNLATEKFEVIARKEYAKWQEERKNFDVPKRPMEWATRMDKLQKANSASYFNYLDRRSGKIEGGIESLTAEPTK